MANSITERLFFEQKVQISKYRLIESNATDTYQKVTNFDAENKQVGKIKEIYYGVELSDKDTIDKTIDISKNILIELI